MTKPAALRFFKFDVSQQVFYQSEYSFCIVNLKPITPHHVLVIPKRHIEFLYQLNKDEKIDFYDTIHTMYRFIRYLTGANGTNLAIQDGIISGQSVPHVHAHIIPRYEAGPDAPKERRERSMEEMISETEYLTTQLQKWLKRSDEEKDKQFVDIPDLDESSTEAK